MENTTLNEEVKEVTPEVKSETSSENDDEYILVVNHLKQYFPIEKNFFGRPTRYLKAVDDVSLKIKKGHTFGLVGESGCGKTTLGRTIISLYDATDGEAYFNGENVLTYNKDNKIASILEFKKANPNPVTENNRLKKAAIKAYKEEHKDIAGSEEYNDALVEIEEVYPNPKEVYNQELEAAKACFLKDKPEATKEEIAEFEAKYEAENPDPVKEYKRKLKEEKTLINSEYKDRKANAMSKKERRTIKPELQMIFQDPYSSLSPRMCVGEIISEAVKEHKLVSKDELKNYTFEIMKKCGLQPYYYQRYPHEFSGGQRQRIGIARSLALNPKLVVCDEPVSALDVSIQAQIINLLKDLQEEKGLSYLFISHDLSVVEHISDDVGVMYLGSLVETGTKDQIFQKPSHPYTLALLSAIPQPDPDYKKDRVILKGELPSPANPPKGCKFHTRCTKCMEVCKCLAPREIDIEPGHMVKCHLFDEEALAKNKELEAQKATEEAKA